MKRFKKNNCKLWALGVQRVKLQMCIPEGGVAEAIALYQMCYSVRSHISMRLPLWDGDTEWGEAFVASHLVSQYARRAQLSAGVTSTGPALRHRDTNSLYTHTDIHICIHKHIHTYTHTHSCVCVYVSLGLAMNLLCDLRLVNTSPETWVF